MDAGNQWPIHHSSIHLVLSKVNKFHQRNMHLDLSSILISKPIYIPVPTKSAGLAAVLAFLIPGLGHIYLGKIGEGLFYLIISIVMAALSPFTLFVLFIPLVVIYWIWQIYDAYKKANQYNRAVQQTGRAPW